jgi:hypothetical protein
MVWGLGLVPDMRPLSTKAWASLSWLSMAGWNTWIQPHIFGACLQTNHKMN